MSIHKITPFLSNIKVYFKKYLDTVSPDVPEECTVKSNQPFSLMLNG